MKIKSKQQRLALKICAAVAAGLLLYSAPSHAADANPPARMTYQGTLVDGNGAPLASASVQNFDVVFRIYNTAQGGTPLWSEQQTVTVDKGNFSVLLGDGVPVASEPHGGLDAAFLGTDVSDRYIGITVKGLGGADAEILPRLRWLTSPFAFLAKNALALVGPTGQSLFDFGNGGIQSSGGNPRGAGSIDLQTTRNETNQVAAGATSVIGGGLNNMITPNGLTDVIAGGVGNFSSGTNTFTGGGVLNTNTGLTTVIGGGYQNWNSGRDATIGGGNQNKASGFASVIGGGFVNKVSGDVATIGGGQNNVNTGVIATISGGVDNIASGDHAVIGGGNTNRAMAIDATIGGGFRNLITGNTSFIGGGSDNTASGLWSVIGGGINNKAGGNTTLIGGGAGNIASGLTATIGGGYLNFASGQESFIGGGNSNTNDTGFWATIGGGLRNKANGEGGFVGGGVENQASGFHAAATAGYQNIASGLESFTGGGFGNVASNNKAIVVGGNINSADGVQSVVVGGHDNHATGLNSMIVGGFQNRTEGEASMAVGYRAKAKGDGIFAWSSREGLDFNVGTPGAFAIRATGGVHIYTNAKDYGDPNRLGMYMPPNGTAWVAHSDKNIKKNFEGCDYKDVLDKLDQVPVTFWNYKGEEDTTPKHLGPVAQDFKAQFYKGTDDKGISTLEFDGVELAAIKGLHEIVKEKDTEIQTLKKQMEELRAMVQTVMDQKSAAAGK